MYISQNYLNYLRSKAYRPEVAVAFIYKKQILFVYKKEHDLWQLAQGGIKENENIEEAGIREMKEELDPNLLNYLDKIIYIMQYKIDFPKHLHNSRFIKWQGKELGMKAKHYFLLAFLLKNNKINLETSDFDDYRWLNYEDALSLVNKIRQKRKKRMLKIFLNKLKLKQIL